MSGHLDIAARIQQKEVNMRRHNRVLITVLLGAGVISALTKADKKVIAAENVPAKAGLDVKDKKIIGFAPNRIDAAYLCQHAAKMENTPNHLPIDGLVISVFPDQWKLRKAYRNMLWFGGAGYTREDYQKAIAGLKATKFTRLTDNFLDFPTTVSNWPTLAAGGDPKFLPAPASYTFANVDWFDEGWSRIAQNGAVAAYIAREGGLKGLMIDTEGYGGGSGPWIQPFSYKIYRGVCLKSGVAPHTPEECLAQVRKRGREFMQAVTAVYPDITIIVIPGIGSTSDATVPLGSAFVDGMLEGSGPAATLVDGMESAYPVQRYDSFVKLRQFTEKDNAGKSKVPELLKRRVSYGFGLWVDFESRATGPFAGWRTDDPKEFELNYRSPARLEHSLHYALKTSDRYVWLYTQHTQWLFCPEARGKDNPALREQSQCPLCPHGEMPRAYLDAFGNCRKPHDVNLSLEKMGDLEERAFLAGWSPPYATKFGERDLKRMGKNLLVNGGFENWSPSPKGGPNGWQIFGSGVVAKEEKKVVKEGSRSAKMTAGKGHGGLDRSIPVEPWRGKTLLFGVWMKSDGTGGLQILDAAPGTSAEGSGGAECLPDGTWQFVVARKRIQKDAAGSVTFRCAGWDSTVYFDGAIAVEEKR